MIAFKRLARGVAFSCNAISGITLLIAALLVSFEVITRKFGHPSVWSEEFAVYLVIWGIYLGLAHAEHVNAHVQMPLLAEMLPSRARRVILAFSTLLCLAFLLVLLWLSIEQALHSAMSGRMTVSIFQLPYYVLHLALPVGLLATILQTLVKLAGLLSGTAPDENATPDETPTDANELTI